MIITENKFFNDTKFKNDIVFIVENTVKAFLRKNERSIFISHKHGEQEFVYRLQDLLEKYGFTGYVDWEDDTMPKDTCRETAKKIKNEIDKAYKFILIASEAAIESKWCNWEIGYADTKKYINHIALLPLKKENEYKGEEYLQIYPSIQVTSNDIHNTSQYYVRYPDDKRMALKDWLTL